MKTRRYSFILLLSAMLLGGCGKSVEKEAKRWERNQQTAAKMQRSYPGYADLVANEVQNADTRWKQALEISDAKEQAKALAQVNQFMTQGVIGEIRSLSSKISSVERKSDSLLKTPKSSTEDMAASFAMKEALSAVATAEAALKKEMADSAVAIRTLQAAEAGLKNAEVSMDKVLKTIRKNQQGTKTAVPVAGTATSVEKTKTSTKAAVKKPDWKCQYCGTKQPDTAYKCKSCGAARK